MTTAQHTYTPRADEVQRGWRVIDAANRPLGRVASEAAQILRGKDKATYSPHMDVGDFVIIVNAGKIKVSGSKETDKTYYSHSGYPGGLKAVSFDRMFAKSPRRVMEYAVWGMLPKGPLGRRLLRKLKVYAEDTHPHGAQVSELASPNRVGKAKKKPKLTKAEREALLAERERSAAEVEEPAAEVEEPKESSDEQTGERQEVDDLEKEAGK